jgi:chloramphenicol O-acetyltransferase
MNLSARGGIAINGTATISSLWMNKKDIEEFYQNIRTTLNQYPLEQVLGWHNVCLETAYQYKTSAIEDIHFEHSVDFNFVLIDGSPFSGESELRCARPFLAEKAIIALDDVNDIKNYANYEKLKRTATLLWEDMACRNGAAIFQL